MGDPAILAATITANVRRARQTYKLIFNKTHLLTCILKYLDGNNVPRAKIRLKPF